MSTVRGRETQISSWETLVDFIKIKTPEPSGPCSAAVSAPGTLWMILGCSGNNGDRSIHDGRDVRCVCGTTPGTSLLVCIAYYLQCTLVSGALTSQHGQLDNL